LEKDFGTKLFFRSKQGISPTKTGQLVYDEAKKTINQFNNLKSKVNDMNSSLQKDLRIGMIDNFGLIFLENIWGKINASFPETYLEIDINNSETLIDLVLNQSIDFAIITQQLKKNISKDLIQHPFAKEDLILVSSEILQPQIQAIEDICKFEFYSYNRKSTTNKLIERFFQQRKLPINITVYSTSPGFIVSLLKFGKSVAFLPKNFVSDKLQNGELVQLLPNVVLERELALIYRRDVYVNERQKEIVNIIQNTKR